MIISQLVCSLTDVYADLFLIILLYKFMKVQANVSFAMLFVHNRDKADDRLLKEFDFNHDRRKSKAVQI